jgi:uncharacterized protein
MARFEGVIHDFADYATSANQTTADAMYHLGLAYSAGRDVPQCAVTAHKWLNLAAIKGHHDARMRRGELAVDMSRSEIADAQRQAREWLNKPKPVAPVVILSKPKSRRAGKIALKIKGL